MGVTELDLRELEDSTLMAWVCEGRHGALEVLYDRYADLTYAFALRMIGEADAACDLVRQVFLEISHEATTFEPYRGPFVRWLLALTHRRGVAELRRRRSGGIPVSALAAAHTGNGAASTSAVQGDADTAAWIGLRRVRVGQALSQLPADQRRAVELAYFGGYRQEEIADLTGEPISAVRSRIRLSMRKLREVLHPEDAGGEPA